MWPNKQGLGVQLGYGAYGHALPVSRESGELESTNLEWPRIPNEGIKLHKVDKGRMQVVPSQITGKGDVPQSKTAKKLSVSESFFPSDILASFSSESVLVDSSVTYDPTYGSLVVFFDVRPNQNQASATAMAYVTGEVGNVLNVGIMRYQKRTIQHESGSEKILLPHFSDEPMTITFVEPIKQIEFCRVHDNFDSIRPHLAVRTDSKIYVLKVVQSAQSTVKATKVGEISIHELEGHEFADMNFNPWNYHQLAVVDVMGSFGLWRVQSKESQTSLTQMSVGPQPEIPRDKYGHRIMRLRKFSHPTIYDPTEISNYKRILWLRDSETLLVMSRSSIFQFTLSPEFTGRKIVSADTWSRILDFKIVTNAMNYAFILTTREIIWLKIENSLTRLIAWKHFLNQSDPSLKLNVAEYDDDSKFICSVYSQVNPIIFVYNFGFKQDKPYCLRDPYFIPRPDSSKRLREFVIHELNRGFFSTIRKDVEENAANATEPNEDSDFARLFGVFELEVDLGLSMSLFSEKSDMSLRKPLDFNLESAQADPEIKPEPKPIDSKLTKDQVASIINAIKPKSTAHEDDVGTIQSYALKLGQGVGSITDSDNGGRYRTLMDISKDLPLDINNLTEFDSMIEQLVEFYESKEINMRNVCRQILSSEVAESTGLEVDGSSQNIYYLLKASYLSGMATKFNRESDIFQSAILLNASSIKAASTVTDSKKLHEEQFKDELEHADAEVQSILGEWDLVTTEESSSKYSTQEIAPTINIGASQNNKKKKKSSNDGGHLRQRALVGSHSASQRMSQHVPHSASQLSQVVDPSELASSSDALESSQPTVPPALSQPMTMPPSSQMASQKRQGSSQSSQRKKKKKGGFA